MIAIRNIFFTATKGGRGSAGVWLGATLAIVAVAAGASLAEVTGGSDPTLQAAFAPAEVPVAAEGGRWAARDGRERSGAARRGGAAPHFHAAFAEQCRSAQAI